MDEDIHRVIITGIIITSYGSIVEFGLGYQPVGSPSPSGYQPRTLYRQKLVIMPAVGVIDIV